MVREKKHYITPELIQIYVSKTSLVSSSATHVFPVEISYVFLAIGHYRSKFLYYNYVCVEKTYFAVSVSPASILAHV